MTLRRRLWKEPFGADPLVVGRAIRFDRQPFIVVGIMPPGIELRLFEQRREPGVYLTSTSRTNRGSGAAGIGMSSRG
jgi:hypothetical protein